MIDQFCAREVEFSFCPGVGGAKTLLTKQRFHDLRVDQIRTISYEQVIVEVVDARRTFLGYLSQNSFANRVMVRKSKKVIRAKQIA